MISLAFDFDEGTRWLWVCQVFTGVTVVLCVLIISLWKGKDKVLKSLNFLTDDVLDRPGINWRHGQLRESLGRGLQGTTWRNLLAFTGKHFNDQKRNVCCQWEIWPALSHCLDYFDNSNFKHIYSEPPRYLVMRHLKNATQNTITIFQKSLSSIIGKILSWTRRELQTYYFITYVKMRYVCQNLHSHITSK